MTHAARRGVAVAFATVALILGLAVPATAAAEPVTDRPHPAAGSDTLSFAVGDPAPAEPSPIGPTPTDWTMPPPAPSSTTLGPTSAVIIPGTRGSVFWYSAYTYNGRVYTVGNVRYSWSHMWYIKNSMSTVQGLITAACGLLPKPANAACAAVVSLVYGGLRSAVNSAISKRKCLAVRFPMPPLGGLVSYRLAQVTCTA